MKKRLAQILAVTLAATTMLTGCGGNNAKKKYQGGVLLKSRK